MCVVCVAASAAAEGTNAGVDAFMGTAVWDLGVVGVLGDGAASGGRMGTAFDIEMAVEMAVGGEEAETRDPGETYNGEYEYHIHLFLRTVSTKEI